MDTQLASCGFAVPGAGGGAAAARAGGRRCCHTGGPGGWPGEPLDELLPCMITFWGSENPQHALHARGAKAAGNGCVR